MFTVQVAADLFGSKLNFELSFPSRPTLTDVSRSTESAFSAEIANRKPENVPSHVFHVAKIKIYNEEKEKWVDLLNENQLVDYCQLYAFQPENPWHKETQQAIPSAVKPPAEAKPSGANYVAKYNGGSAQRSTAASAGGALTSTSNALAPYTGGRGSEAGSSRRAQTAAAAGSVSTALALRNSSIDVTPEEKIRIVFSEFDNKGVRMIDMDDFTRGFRSMNIDLPASTVEELFLRADLNRDNRISYAEFERFSKLYPIMMDCLFFRSKAFWEEEQLRKEIQAARDAVERAENGFSVAQQQLGTAEQDVATAINTVRSADEELKSSTEKMRDLAKDVDDAKKDRERAVREKKDRETDLQDMKEREAAARKQLQDVSRDVDKLERRATSLATDAASAEDKVRQLQKALEEARRASDRASDAAEQARAEADAAKEAERNAGLNADMVSRDVPKADEAVRAAERNVTSVDQVLKELDAVGKELGREADEASRRRDAGERSVSEAKDRAAQKSRDVESARQNVDDRERGAREKEAELEDHRRQRQLITQHESSLINQELRLRQQRDSLEDQETRLLSEATSFLTNVRNNVSAGRSYSRDPSAF